MKTLLEHIRHLQERLNAAEARNTDLEGALRPFAKAWRRYIGCGDGRDPTDFLEVEAGGGDPFAHAAELVTDDGGK